MEPSSNGITFPYPSYRPNPKTAEETLASDLRLSIHGMQIAYANRAQNIEALVKCAHEILQKTKGRKDERAFIHSGYQHSMEPFRNQREGGPFLMWSAEAAAYSFLEEHQNFNGTALNQKVIDQGIANLSRKATESRAAAELFATIDSDASFQGHPLEYIEKWRKSIEDPTVAQRKVLKHLDSKAGCNQHPYAPSFGKNEPEKEPDSSLSDNCVIL